MKKQLFLGVLALSLLTPRCVLSRDAFVLADQNSDGAFTLGDLFKAAALNSAAAQGAFRNAASDQNPPTQKAGLADNTFGSSGIKTFNVSGTDVGSFVTELPDGKLVFAGTRTSGAFNIFVSADGNTTHKTNSHTTQTSIFGLTQGGGNVYVYGGDGTDAKIMGYDSFGNTLTTFGTSGVVTISGALTGCSGNGALYFDGGLFIIANGAGTLELYKYDATGTAITAFNSGTAVDLDADGFTGITAIAGYGDHIYVCGIGATNNEIRKYDATTGAQVTTGFGTSGVATTASSSTLNGMSIDQSTGEIYLLEDGGATAIVYKFKTDGTLDSWGDSLGGSLTIATFADAQSVIAAPGGVQYVMGDDSGTAKVARISGGALDSNFGFGGILTTGSASQLNYALTTKAGHDLVAVGDDGSDAVLWKITGGSGTGTAEDIIKDNAQSGGTGSVG